MRARPLTAAVATASLAVALSPALSGAAHADSPDGPPADSSPVAQEVLDTATALLSGQDVPADATGDVTAALLDLRDQLPQLDAADRRQARSLFARPDGTNGTTYDLSGSTWTTAEKRAAKSTCTDPAYAADAGAPFCVHWVPAGTTDNGVPSHQAATDDAVAKTVATLRTVWDTETGTAAGQLGFRTPKTDGLAGGGAGKLDVYLADTGAGGAYGYAVPEQASQASSGYLVLDNDFSLKQFPSATTTPDEARQVTAAHEFFHLVQFAYDSYESPWLMESSATWMEEHVYDGINDNRQFIADGSERWPGQPLDSFDGTGPQYGTWVFHELVGQRLGLATMREVWDVAASREGDNAYSALSTVYARHGSSLAQEFRAFTAASMAPAVFWSEGGAYPSAVISHSWALGRAKKSIRTQTAVVDHLASADFRFRPRAGLTARTWKLRLSVNAPSAGATAIVLVRYRDGHVGTYPLTLDDSGNVTKSFPFSVRTVSRVKVALGNATRADGRRTTFSARIWR